MFNILSKSRFLTSLSNIYGRRHFLSIFNVEQKSDHFILKNGMKETKVTFNWLRDHCRSPQVYDSRTHQRKLDIAKVSFNSEPIDHEGTESDLVIRWNDGHVSRFTWSWLQQNCSNDLGNNFHRSFEPILWDSANPPTSNDTGVDYDLYMKSNEGLAKALTCISKFGFCNIVNSPPTFEATKNVSQRLGQIMKTPYGEMWEFSSNQPDNVSDSSYTSEALGPHTDGTYFTQAPGIQVFHCLKSAMKGGENILVDGFNVAQNFRNKYPDAYDFFRTTGLEAEYIHSESEPHFHLHNVDVVFRHHPHVKDRLLQVRYNVYDRAPHHMSLENQRNLYSYFPLLAKEINDENNFHTFQLQPGNVLLVDNWRVLHGRHSFEGNQRIMSGCYIARTDLASKARVLGISL